MPVAKVNDVFCQRNQKATPRIIFSKYNEFVAYLQSKVFTKVGEQDTVDRDAEEGVENHQDTGEVCGRGYVAVSWKI